MSEPIQPPPVNKCFINPARTEIYRVLMADDHYVWVKVLDLQEFVFWRCRGYGTRNFLREMRPFDETRLVDYGQEIELVINDFADQVRSF